SHLVHKARLALGVVSRREIEFKELAQHLPIGRGPQPLGDRLQPGIGSRWRADSCVRRYYCRGHIGIAGCEIKDDHPSQAVADEDRLVDPQLTAEPGEVVGESGDGVFLLWLLALAVTMQIHRHHPLGAAEVLEL